MSDGDFTSVNPNLLNKLKQTTAEEWREERRRAFQARKLGLAQPLASSTGAAASYLPTDYNENETSEDGGVAAVTSVNLKLTSSSSSLEPSSQGFQQNMDLVKNLLASRGQQQTKPAVSELTPNAVTPAVGQKRGREEDQQPHTTAPPTTVASAAPVACNGGEGGGGGLKAALMARLKAKIDAEAAVKKVQT